MIQVGQAQASVRSLIKLCLLCSKSAMDCLSVIYAMGLLVFGAMNTLATKLTFQMKSLDLSGLEVPFQKPWFGVYRMFQGMAIVMLLHFTVELKNRCQRRGQQPDLEEPLKDGASLPPAPTPFRSYMVVALPAALDLFGTVCTYVGLVYNTPSVWQMFRGAMVLFATFFSVVILKRKLSPCRIFGIFVVMVALILVGVSNMLSEQPAGLEVPVSLRLFGMGMILLGMFLQGGQVVLEELLMKDLNAPPLMVVGMEGVWGCIMMMVVIFPIVGYIPGNDYGGVQESLENDFEMVENSEKLQKVIVVYLVSVFTFNIAGMMVTYQLSAVHRTLLEASRTAVIWAIDLCIHAYMPESTLGETWNNWSYLQLAGFVLLVVGQATYGEMITWGFKTSRTKAVSPFTSPSSLRSPAGQLHLGVDLPEADGDTSFALVEEN